MGCGDTRRSALQSVAGFYAWAGERHAVGVDPSRVPTVRASAPAQRPADAAAIARARLSPDWRVRLAVRLASELGLRRGEVAKVRGCDLVCDLHGWSLIVHGKGGKPRTVPVSESIAVEIQGHGPGWLFPGADSGHVSAVGSGGWLGVPCHAASQCTRFGIRSRREHMNGRATWSPSRGC